MKKILLLLTLLLAICISLAACGGAPMGTANNTPETASADASGVPTTDVTGQANTTSNSDLAVRKLIKDATLQIETKAFDNFMNNLKAEIDKDKGYIESSELNGNTYNSFSSSNRYATVVARIPADKLGEFTNQVSSLGNITSKSENVKDVTKEYVDVESRIKALKTEQDSLLSLMKSAKNLSDIITIQDRLTKVRTDLESYESQLRNYKDLVAYSTVTMNINEVERETTVAPKGMWQQIGSNLSNNLSDIGSGLKSFFIWFVSSLPYLLIFGLILALSIAIPIKISRRQRKQFAPPQPPQNSEPPQPPEQL